MTKRANPGSAHDALGRMLDAIGRDFGAAGVPSEGLPLAADFLGISHWTLRKQLDPDQAGSELSFARVAQLTRQFGCADAAEHLALCAGGVFVPLPDRRGQIGLLSAEAMREMGETMREIFAALADHSEGGSEMTGREAARVLPPLSETLHVLTTLYAQVSAAAGNSPSPNGDVRDANA